MRGTARVNGVEHIDWQGYRFDLDPDGGLGALWRNGRLIGSGLLVRPAGEGWRLTGRQADGQEIRWQWVDEQGCRAEIRMEFDEDIWQWRARLSNLSDQPVAGAGLALSWTPAFPHPCWLGGGRALVVLDEDFTDGTVLVAEQRRGEARPSEAPDELATLTPRPLALAAGETVAVTWTVGVHPQLRTLSSHLPGWLPASLAVTTGEEILIADPDAGVSIGEPGVSASSAVTSQNLAVGTTDDGTLLSAERGRQHIEVHEASGNVGLELAWGESLEAAVRRRAGEILTIDPRLASSAQALLVSRALRHQLVPQDDGVQFLAAAVDELARAGSVDPFTLGCLVDQTERDAGLMDTTLQAADRLRPGVGAQLAWLAASFLALSAERSMSSPPPVDEDAGVVAVSLQRAERGVFQHRREATPDLELWMIASLLGYQLPGQVGDDVSTAQALAITQWTPEHWDVTQRWPHSLSDARTQASFRLLAGEPDDVTLAWLAW
jgi:hypothetical protein